MEKSLKSVFLVLSLLVITSFSTWFWAFKKAQNQPLMQVHQTAANHHTTKRLFVSVDQADASTVLQLDPEKITAQVGQPVELGLWYCIRLDVRFDPKTPTIAPTSEAVFANCETSEKIATLDQMALPNQPVPIVIAFDTRQPGLEAPATVFLRGLSQQIQNHVLLQIDSDGLSKSLRTELPSFAFGTPQAKIAQLEVASSVGLMPLVNLNSDALVTLQTEVLRVANAASTKRARIRAELTREAHRRGLKRYAGPAQSVAEAKEILAAEIDGVFIPSRLLR